MLTISASGTASSLWLAPRLAAFAAQHPSVQWQVRAIEDEEPDMLREGLDLAMLRVRRGRSAGWRHDAVQRNGVPGVQPVAAVGRKCGRVAAAHAVAGGPRASPEKDWSTWLELLGSGAEVKATIVRFCTFSAALAAAVAGAGIALGRRPLIDPELAAGRLVRVFPDRMLAGSSDFVIRHRPGMERDRHVGQLAEYLLGS